MKLSKKERTQKDIINAAKAIVHDKGHEAITVRYLAELTGFSYTNVYYYFKDMNSLLWALKLDLIEDMIAELTSISIQVYDALDEIIEIFSSYMSYFLKHPNVFRFFYFFSIVAPENDDSYEQLDVRFRSLWQTSFARLLQEGMLLPDEIEVVAKIIIYSLQGMIMLSFSSNGTMNESEVKAELAKTIRYLFNKR